MLKKRKARKVVFDMDGVLAEYGTDYNTPGFFLGLKENQKLLEVIQILQLNDVPVEICSVAPKKWMVKEKKAWLKKHGLNIPAHFVKSGRDKLKYIKNSVLIDDHSPNLIKAKHVAHQCIKWDNGINCKNGIWGRNGGKILSHQDDVDIIAFELLKATE